MIERFNLLRGKLKLTPWWLQTYSLLLQTLGDGVEYSVQCLGLGSFEGRQASFHQLACASLIQNMIGAKSCSVSDPCMTERDVQLIADLGFVFKKACSADNTQIEAGHVILFMPHCGKELNMSILRHWVECPQPENVVYFGNVLSSYLLSNDAANEILSQLVNSKALVEKRCPDAKFSTLECAFNDLAVVTIRH